MEKKALGRGLEALLPTEDDRNIVINQTIASIEVEHILPNRYQPRRGFPEEDLKELTDSVKQTGLLQPVLVRRKGDGFYELIAGERRWRAAKLAGFDSIPAIVRNCTDQQAMVFALIENLQRHDLNPMETAGAYHRMLNEFGMTQDDLAQQVGKDRSSIANLVRLVTLPSEIKGLVEAGVISTGHAKVILGLGGSDQQIRLARKIVDGQLSVRQAEMVAGTEVRAKKAPARGTAQKPYLGLEERMQKFLGTKVVITQKRKCKGKIVIHYFSEPELQRVADVLVGNHPSQSGR